MQPKIAANASTFQIHQRVNFTDFDKTQVFSALFERITILQYIIRHKTNIILILFICVLAIKSFAQDDPLPYNYVQDVIKENYLPLKYNSYFDPLKIKKHPKVKEFKEGNKYFSSSKHLEFKEEYYAELIANPEEIYAIIEYVFSFKERNLKFTNKTTNKNSTHQFMSANIAYKDKLVDKLKIRVSNYNFKNLRFNLILFNPENYFLNEKYSIYFSNTKMFDEVEIENVIPNAYEFKIKKLIILYKESIKAHLSKDKYKPFKDIYKYARLDSNLYTFKKHEELEGRPHQKTMTYNLIKIGFDATIGDLKLTYTKNKLDKAILNFYNESQNVYYSTFFEKYLPTADTLITQAVHSNHELKHVQIKDEYIKSFTAGKLMFEKDRYAGFKSLDEKKQKDYILNSVKTHAGINADALKLIKTKDQQVSENKVFALFRKNRPINYTIEWFENNPLIYASNSINVYHTITSNKPFFPKNDTLKSLDYQLLKTKNKDIDVIHLKKGLNSKQLHFSFIFKNLTTNSKDTAKAIKLIKKFLGFSRNVKFDLVENDIFYKGIRLHNCPINIKTNSKKQLQIDGSYFNPIENGQLHSVYNQYYINADTSNFNNSTYVTDLHELIYKIVDNKIYFLNLKQLYYYVLCDVFYYIAANKKDVKRIFIDRKNNTILKNEFKD